MMSAFQSQLGICSCIVTNNLFPVWYGNNGSFFFQYNDAIHFNLVTLHLQVCAWSNIVLKQLALEDGQHSALVLFTACLACFCSVKLQLKLFTILCLVTLKTNFTFLHQIWFCSGFRRAIKKQLFNSTVLITQNSLHY